MNGSKRTSIEVIYNILSLVLKQKQRGIIVSKILRGANLSYNMFVQYITALEKVKAVEHKIKEDSNGSKYFLTKYFITQRGIELMNSIEKILFDINKLGVEI